MSWIKTIPFAAATGRLKTLYDRVKGPDDNVDNIMMAHSLRPHTMEGHMALYKYVLHHTGNTLEKSFLELIGTWVSMLNTCHYCVEHHYAGMCRLLGDGELGATYRAALDAKDIQSAVFDTRQHAALAYAQKLTLSPSELTEQDITLLRDAGFSDGEILELNQVTSYFSYANRTVLGLGVSTDGDVLGLSPGNSDNPNDWNHT